MKVTIYSDKQGKKVENGKVWYTPFIGLTYEVYEDEYYKGEQAMYRITNASDRKYAGYGIFIKDTIEPIGNLPDDLFEV